MWTKVWLPAPAGSDGPIVLVAGPAVCRSPSVLRGALPFVARGGVESYCLKYLGSVHTCHTYMWAVTTVWIVESILVDPSCMHARIYSSCHKEGGGQPVRSPGFRHGSTSGRG